MGEYAEVVADRDRWQREALRLRERVAFLSYALAEMSAMPFAVPEQEFQLLTDERGEVH